MQQCGLSVTPAVQDAVNGLLRKVCSLLIATATEADCARKGDTEFDANVEKSKWSNHLQVLEEGRS
jgi:hypothetical protein